MAHSFIHAPTRILLFTPKEIVGPRLMEFLLHNVRLTLPGSQADEELVYGRDSRDVEIKGQYIPINVVPFDDDIKDDPAKLLARMVLRGEQDAVWPLIDVLLDTRGIS